MDKIKVLIVEDEILVARDLQMRLSQWGYAVAGIATTGKQAIQKVKEECPDVVLMDIRLQGEMDGIKTAEILHSESDIPVVYVTAHGEDATFERAKKTGPYGYIIKPYVKEDLRKIIEIVLYKRKSEEERKKLIQELRMEVDERKKVEKTLEMRVRQQAFIAYLGDKALKCRDITFLMNEVVSGVADILNNEYCKVLELLPDGKDMLLKAGVGWKEGLVGQATVYTGVDSQAGYTLQSNEPVIVEDLRTETRFSGPPLLHDHNVVSGISVIIQGQDGPWGVLGTHTTRHMVFSIDDINFIQSVANLLTDVICRKKLEEVLADRTNMAVLGANVGRILTRSDNIMTTLQLCAEVMVEQLDAAFARIWTFNSMENMLELQASAGIYTHIDGSHSRIPVGSFKIGLIAQERKPYLTNSVIGDSSIQDQEWAMREGIVSFAGYPMLLEDSLVGVMALFSRKPLSEFTMQVLESLAGEIVLGIERIKAEEKLRDNEERLRAIMSSLHETAIVVYDRDGYIVNLWATPEMDKKYGIPASDVEGKSLRDFLPPEQAEKRLALIRQIFDHGEKLLVEEFATLPGGDFWHETSLCPMRNANGDIIAVVGYARDITDRKKTEEQIRKLSHAVEQSPSVVIITDTKGDIEYVNPKFSQLTGYTSNEVIGQNPSILKSGETSPETYERLWSTIKSGKEWYGVFRNKKKNGDLYWERASISPIKNDEGIITHFVAVKEDITERIHARDNLRRLNEQLQASVDYMPIGYILWDREFRVLEWNNAAERIFGYSKNEVLGKFAVDLIVPETVREQVNEAIRQLQDGEMASYSEKNNNVKKDGKLISCQWYNTPLKDKEGKIFGILSMVDDVIGHIHAE